MARDGKGLSVDAVFKGLATAALILTAAALVAVPLLLEVTR